MLTISGWWLLLAACSGPATSDGTGDTASDPADTGSDTSTDTGSDTSTDAGPYAVSVSGDWSRQHDGQGLTFFARVVDDADGTVAACGSQTADGAIWLVTGEAILVAGRDYHAEAFADVNGNGLADDDGHTYESNPGGVVSGAQSFEVAHRGDAPAWTGTACNGEPALTP
jgi:hypothetical protein